MFGRKKNVISDEEVREIGRQVLRVASASEHEIEAAAASPNGYVLLRTRIELERKQLQEPQNPWLTTIVTARRAIPAMALIAAAASGMFWYMGKAAAPELTGFDLIREFEFVHPPVTACSISSKSECVISNEEVLATMLTETSEGEVRR